MTRFQHRILQRALKIALRRPCPDRIARSGEEGKSQNCYIVSLDKGDDPYFAADGITNDGLSGILYDGKRYNKPHFLSFEELENLNLEIVHYYGLTDIRFKTPKAFLLHRITRIIYLRVQINRFIKALSQALFNRKDLVRIQRIELLRVLVQLYSEEKREHISALQIMMHMYGMKWALHPHGDSKYRKLRLILDSFVKSGELINHGDGYRVMGKAIVTLDEYEESERRHHQNVNLQRIIVLLTLVIVIFAAIQADIIKLPTLLDLTDLFRQQ